MWHRRKQLNPDAERSVKDRERSRERTMNRAVKLLAAKPRSVAELRERLLEKLWTDEAIVESVLTKLIEYNYLNDEQYAHDLALSKLRNKPQGKRRLERSMAHKKLDRSLVDAAISNAFEKFPEEDLIDQAIERRLRSRGKPVTREDRKKFFDHLLRQGFSFDLIRDKMKAIDDRGLEDLLPDLP
jgi:regulatory protein